MPERIPAKKSLGQCFLAERSYAARIAGALGLAQSDIVLEIGPGRGILTEELLHSGARVISVEIDRRLIEPLQEKFGAQPGFQLHHEDFLNTDLSAILPHGSLKVAGNLPYHLVAEVIFKLLAHARRARGDFGIPWVECAVLMMQKEVADRITAIPGSKTWGKISVFVQQEARVQQMFAVPSGAFRPTPKVDGGVVRLDFLRAPERVPHDFATFERMVRFCFSQRRKMLKTSLSAMAGIHPFWKLADFDFTRRPETLSPVEWIELADTVAAARTSPVEKSV